MGPQPHLPTYIMASAHAWTLTVRSCSSIRIDIVRAGSYSHTVIEFEHAAPASDAYCPRASALNDQAPASESNLCHFATKPAYGCGFVPSDSSETESCCLGENGMPHWREACCRPAPRLSCAHVCVHNAAARVSAHGTLTLLLFEAMA